MIVPPRIPEQGGHLTILCEAPYSPLVDQTQPFPGMPRPNDSYGLQRAVVRSEGDRL